MQLLVLWSLLPVSIGCNFTVIKRVNPSTTSVLTLVIRLLWDKRNPVMHAKIVMSDASVNVVGEVQSQ